MAGNIKGITIEFRGDTTKLDKALKDVDKKTRDIDKELKEVNKDLKFNPTSVELWRQKQQLLNDKVKETKDRLDVLKKAQKKMDADGVDKNSEQYRKLQREIIETESKLKTFEGQLRKVGDAKLTALSKSLDEVSKKTQKLSAAGAALGGALLANTYHAARQADEIETLAQRYGVSTDEIQKMNYAQNLVDVDTQSMLSSMQRMTKQMGQNNDAFKELGVSITNTDGSMRDSTDVWYDVLAALGKVENETQRDILAQELFGRSAAELAGIIDDGGASLKAYGQEAEDAGVILSEDGVDAAVAFNDAIDRLKATITGDLLKAGAQLAEQLVPILQKIVQWASKLFGWLGNLDGGTQKIILVIAGAIAAISPVAGILSKITQAISILKTVLLAATGPVGLIVTAVGALAAGLIYAYNHSEKFRAVVNSVFNFVKGLVQNVINNIIERFNALKEGIKSVISFIQGIVQTVKNIIQKIKDAIKLPHFSITGDFSLMPPSIPKIGVDWYAKGGIFNSPSLIGVGEAGSEAVVPLDKLWENMARMNTGGIVINVYPSENMNVNELVSKIKRELITAEKWRANAWA